MDVTFEKSKGHDEWLTPPEIVKSLGQFDLDPCSPINRPWDTAKKHYTKNDNGLYKEWHGRVWCNPPYGTETGKWLLKCAAHKNATALVFARTETQMFFDSVWNKATALLFIKGRLSFYTVDGKRGGSSGAPSVLIAYDVANANNLQRSGIKGKFVLLV